MPTLIILHGCRTIQLTQGFNTLLDEGDFARISHLRWHVLRSSKHSLCYASHIEYVSKGKTKSTPMHRWLTNAPADLDVDHRNGDGLDNRRDNLRLVSHKQNHQNRAKHRGESKFKGVHRNRDRWNACICKDGKRTSLGRFMTQEEAARAYDEAAKKLFGSFARTNIDLFGEY